jgi:hypothetical protein
MATMNQLIKNAGYKTKEAKQISEYLKSIGVVDIPTLENIPTKVGPRLFGHDTYSFIMAVREAASKPVKPKRAPAVKTEEVEETVATGDEES